MLKKFYNRLSRLFRGKSLEEKLRIHMLNAIAEQKGQDPTNWEKPAIMDFLLDHENVVCERIEKEPQLARRYRLHTKTSEQIRKWSNISEDTFKRIFKTHSSKGQTSTWHKLAIYFGYDSKADYARSHGLIKTKNTLAKQTIVATSISIVLLTTVWFVVTNGNVIFSENAGFKVLVVPLTKFAYVEGQAYNHHLAVKERLASLVLQEKLKMQVETIDDKIVSTIEEAYEVGHKYGADVVVFGNFADYLTPIKSKISLQYAFIDSSYHRLDLVKQADQQLMESSQIIDDIRNGEITGFLEEVLYTILGTIEHKESNWARAIELYSKAEESGTITQPGLYMNKGYDYDKLNKHKEAMEYTQKAVFLDSNNVRSLNNLGIFARKNKEFGIAEKALRRALEIDDKYWKVYVSLGNVLYKVNRYQEALEAYSECIKLNPGDSLVYLNRAYVYMILGKYDLAIDDNNRYVKISGNINDPIYQYNLGELYHKMGQQELALQHMIKADKVLPYDYETYEMFWHIYDSIGNKKIALRYQIMADSLKQLQ